MDDVPQDDTMAALKTLLQKLNPKTVADQKKVEVANEKIRKSKEYQKEWQKEKKKASRAVAKTTKTLKNVTNVTLAQMMIRRLSDETTTSKMELRRRRGHDADKDNACVTQLALATDPAQGTPIESDDMEEALPLQPGLEIVRVAPADAEMLSECDTTICSSDASRLPSVATSGL